MYIIWMLTSTADCFSAGSSRDLPLILGSGSALTFSSEWSLSLLGVSSCARLRALEGGRAEVSAKLGSVELEPETTAEPGGVGRRMARATPAVNCHGD